jgi:hypothetical protein
MNLLAQAWDEKPSGSLPNNDAKLCHFSGVRPCHWDKRKASIMRGWILCSDGRWYSRLAATGVALAWTSKQKGKLRNKGNEMAVASALFDAIGPAREYLAIAVSPHVETGVTDQWKASGPGVSSEWKVTDPEVTHEWKASEIEIREQNQGAISGPIILDKTRAVARSATDQIDKWTGPFSQTDEQFIARVASGEASF